MNRLFHLHDFAVWLNRTEIHLAVQRFTRSSLYAIPVVQGIHLIAVCIIIGSIGMIGLRMAGVGGAGSGQSLAAMVRRLLPWTWGAIVVQFATGIFMVIDRPTRAIDSLTFPYKMAMLLVGILLTVFLSIAVRRRPDYWDAPTTPRLAARVVGLASVALWLGIIVAGRWIYYEKAAL